MPGRRALQAEPGGLRHAVRMSDHVQYLKQLVAPRCVQGRRHRNCCGYRLEQGVYGRGWTGLYLQHHEWNRARQLQRDGDRYRRRCGLHGRDQRWRQHGLLTASCRRIESTASSRPCFLLEVAEDHVTSHSKADVPIAEVIAIAAHRDDVEQTCGGTLLRMRSLGVRTAILDLTRGEAGTRGTVEERAAEAQEAAKILGVAWRDALDIPDGRVENTYENRVKIVEVLRRVRPRVVILPYGAGRHPDHY